VRAGGEDAIEQAGIGTERRKNPDQHTAALRAAACRRVLARRLSMHEPRDREPQRDRVAVRVRKRGIDAEEPGAGVQPAPAPRSPTTSGR